jgi:sugar (pentulose or hexulose) kinase
MHSLLLGNGETVSALTTWQDQQCSDAFLNRVNRSANITLRNGFGGATLARHAAENALGNWDFCATISDYLTAVLAGNSRIVTDPTHAASWGIFDIAGNKWNEKALEVLNIPVELLPEVQASGTVIGRLSPEYAEKLGLEAGIPIVNYGIAIAHMHGILRRSLSLFPDALRLLD